MRLFGRSTSGLVKDLVKEREYQKLVEQHRLGNHVVSQLITLLDDIDSWVCAKAAWALGEISVSDAEATKDAVPKLISLLDDERAHIRGNATGALWAIGKSEAEAVKDAIPKLISLLDDEDADIRYNAAWALGTIGKSDADAVKNAVPKLVRLLDDKDTDVRYNAVRALGTIEAEEALEPLHQLLEDNSEAPGGKTVAEVARETIIRIEQKIRMSKALEMLAALRAQIDSL